MRRRGRKGERKGGERVERGGRRGGETLGKEIMAVLLEIVLEFERGVKQEAGAKADIGGVDDVHKAGELDGERGVGGNAVIPPKVIEALSGPEIAVAIGGGIHGTPRGDSLDPERIVVGMVVDDLEGLCDGGLGGKELLLEECFILSDVVKTRSINVLIKTVNFGSSEGCHVGGLLDVEDQSDGTASWV